MHVRHFLAGKIACLFYMLKHLAVPLSVVGMKRLTVALVNHLEGTVVPASFSHIACGLCRANRRNTYIALLVSV